ncbi:hypothetical protein [Gramella sp. MAR_2010_147]|uniref:hypothetical protein n=1 Tax=Gramella sp. MAR_2010_147 TaxID=1250205 RepID=UPI00087C4D88|nr:hypothetical protein [Gramella sp. MAR_2010_147]SDS42847.1 hypothetical protein SAMN04488553_2235 [Gramella sp. MAR_2010_147]
MKFLIFVAVFLFSVNSFSQKETQEIIDAHHIKSIQINTDEVFLVRIISVKSSKIRIKTYSEGEYFRQIVLESSINGDELLIDTNYPKQLAGGYDKLSAHKVFSLEVHLEIPEGLEINIRSNIASLEAKGEFKSVNADLKQGYCKLTEFSGAATINTYSGNILIETTSGLIDASSRNGEVETPDFMPGRNPLRLTSIDGDIKVRKN